MLKKLNRATAAKLIDFSGGDSKLASLADTQLDGAVALHNMIAEQGLGYLADEVGTGKTYMALGVVALMRYLHPSLQVLYLIPSANVQEKWINEYQNFIGANFSLRNDRVKTLQGKIAAPYANCANMESILHHATEGYYADYFTRLGSFSFSLNDDLDFLEGRLRKLKELIPARDWDAMALDEHSGPDAKRHVKKQYARALNYVLPEFDLVVIDEAHNLKHDFASSDRNLMLSRVLGFTNEPGFERRANAALLLSATPYDRNLQHLRNQLAIVGKADLLPQSLDRQDQNIVKAQLAKFLVRRLNRLELHGKVHTRNMYRKEHRTGPQAEIQLASDEQKLVMALVQKKVGESLQRNTATGSFQTGMLASFESFAESAASEPVQFDGQDEQERSGKDAADKHVVAHMVDSYRERDLGRMLPHPKMDSVTDQLQQDAFYHGEKSLVFVRRVKSVNELKSKLDEAYNEYLHGYLMQSLADNPAAKATMDALYRLYLEKSCFKDNRDLDDGFVGGDEAGSQDDAQPPKNDNFFTWFFRGTPESAARNLVEEGSSGWVIPEDFRKALTSKYRTISLCFEINWVAYLVDREQLHFSHDEVQAICRIANQYLNAPELSKQNSYSFYHAAQAAVLDFLGDEKSHRIARQLLGHYYPVYAEISQAERQDYFTTERLLDQLGFSSFFNALHESTLGNEIFTALPKAYEAILNNTDDVRTLKRLDIQRELLFTELRIDHGFIDLYLMRILMEDDQLDKDSYPELVRRLIDKLQRQPAQGLSTRRLLGDITRETDLIIKTNFNDLYDRERLAYRETITRNLSPLTPVIGATGETYSGRSNQARKFRMPGYPLILISTDVFQEGEDLHTFCASVMHYGLSGSPVSIEQKIGRVDRVSSLAQRRLLKSASDDYHQHFIQVIYPYVKESIEVIQVRNLCQNINEFIASLHDFGSKKQSANDIIDAEAQLQDDSAIPEQITDFLESPYEVVLEAGLPDHVGQITEIDSRKQRIVEHVQQCLAELPLKGISPGGSLRQTVYYQGEDRPTEFRLESARASGELLLQLKSAGPEFEWLTDTAALIDFMQTYCWRTFHCTHAVQTATREYQLYDTAEMMVGGPEITQAEEIAVLFNRFHQFYEGAAIDPSITKLTACIDFWRQQDSIPFDRGHQASFELLLGPPEIAIEFSFGQHVNARKQKVRIKQIDDHIMFYTAATEEGYCSKLSPQKLIEHTWLRNAQTDLVEFLPDNKSRLVGRALHPLAHLQPEEFMYCAYTVAVEADRLEFILSEQDSY